jgi:hypothetical protein
MKQKGQEGYPLNPPFSLHYVTSLTLKFIGENDIQKIIIPSYVCQVLQIDPGREDFLVSPTWPLPKAWPGWCDRLCAELLSKPRMALTISIQKGSCVGLLRPQKKSPGVWQKGV